MKRILCKRCNKEVKYKEDLVVTTYILPFILHTYHNECYVQREKKTWEGYAFLGSIVNTRAYIVVSIIGILLIPILFLVERREIVLYTLIIIILLYSIVPPILSRLKYENKLPRRSK